jgi:hypothetical protein
VSLGYASDGPLRPELEGIDMAAKKKAKPAAKKPAKRKKK